MSAVTSTAVFPVPSAKSTAFGFLMCFAVILFLSAMAAGWVAHRNAGALYIAMVVELLVGVMLVYLAQCSRSTKVELDSTSLRIRGTMFGKTISRAELVADQARLVDLNVETELAPKWRLYGVGLPSYQAGWFTLRGGGKGLVFLTDKSRAVHVPTRNGYAILLTVVNPAELLAALKLQK